MTLDPELAHLLDQRNRYFIDYLIPDGETEDINEGQWATVLAPIEINGTLDLKGRLRIIQS